MPLLRALCTVTLVLCLTACLKVTGEAKDQFDVEDEEDSLGFGATFTAFGSRSEENTTDELGSKTGNAAEETTIEPVAEEPIVEPVDVPDAIPSTVETPSIDPATIDPQEFADFQQWKRERDGNSAEYQEFQDYQEYKKWLELQKE